MYIEYKDVSHTKMAYAVVGEGKIDVVIEMGLGACMGEWWQTACALTGKHTVLLYERLGIGSSRGGKSERTPKQIAGELKELLQQLPHREKITIVGHSQGGLYARQFAQMYPELVEKLVLLDPLSPEDNRFQCELTKKEYKRSGICKSTAMRINLVLARLHLGGIIKGFMKQAPPFYYYDGFSEEEKNYILDCLTMPGMYKTALEEYKLSHEEKYLAELKNTDVLQELPVCLITHSSDIAVRETMKFGGVSEKEAVRIEALWQDIMKSGLENVKNVKFLHAEHSGHYIHLTDLQLLCDNV